MKNAVGREIPAEALAVELKNGRKYEPYQGKGYRDGKYIKKAGPTSKIYEKPQESKILPSIRDAVIACGVKDGMTVSFHHHFRNGDYIVNMVMKEIVDLGIKDITIAASSLGDAHDPIAEYIEQGIVTGIQTSGIRGKMGDVVSHGKLKTPAILRSHGGRVRAIEEGDVHIDVAFIGAPTSDEYGNARALGGKGDCGVLSYAVPDSEYADKVVVITDTLVPYPNFPPSIHGRRDRQPQEDSFSRRENDTEPPRLDDGREHSESHRGMSLVQRRLLVPDRSRRSFTCGQQIP